MTEEPRSICQLRTSRASFSRSLYLLTWLLLSIATASGDSSTFGRYISKPSGWFSRRKWIQNNAIESIMVGVPRGGKVEEQRDIDTPEKDSQTPRKSLTDDDEGTNESEEDEEEFYTPAEDEEWEDEQVETRRHEVDAVGWELENEENYDDINSGAVEQDDMGVYSLDVEISDAQNVVGGEAEDEEDTYEYFEVEDNDELDIAEEQTANEIEEASPERLEVEEIEEVYEYVDEEEGEQEDIEEELKEGSSGEILEKSEESENEQGVEDMYEYVEKDTNVRTGNDMKPEEEEQEAIGEEFEEESSGEILEENEESENEQGVEDMYEYVEEDTNVRTGNDVIPEEEEQEAIGEEFKEGLPREVLEENEEPDNDQDIEDMYEYVEEDTEVRVENEILPEAEKEEEADDNSFQKAHKEDEEFVDARMDEEVDIEDDESNHSIESFQDDAQVEESLFEEDQYEDLVDAASVDDLVVPEKSQPEADESWEEVPVDIQEEQAPFMAEATIENNEVPIGSTSGAVDFGTDDDSSANVDRMDLADREDEGETTTGGFGEIDALEDDTGVPGDDPSDAPDAPDDDDEKSPTEQAAEPVQEEESAKATNEEEERQLVTTKEMRKILKGDLGYTAREVRHMKPAIAAVVTDKRLRRPNEGMPRQWYQNGPPSEIIVTLENMLRLYLKPAIIAMVAGWAATQNVGDSNVQASSSSKKTRKKRSKEARKKGKVEPVQFSPPPVPPAETYGLSEHKPQKLEEKDRARALLTHDPRTEHSIPPNVSDVEASNPEPTDNSVVDKAITGIENLIKKVLSAEFPKKNS